MVGGVMVPSLELAKLRLHLWVSGLYSRRLNPSKCPPGPSATSSTRLARPPHTFLTVVTPSISTHVVEPVRGCSRRLTCVFHVPILKSKSWLISAVDIFSPCGKCLPNGLCYWRSCAKHGQPLSGKSVCRLSSMMSLLLSQ